MYNRLYELLNDISIQSITIYRFGRNKLHMVCQMLFFLPFYVQYVK